MNGSANFLDVSMQKIMRTATSQTNNDPAEHILLVDDNRMGLSARKLVLEQLGYQITTFTSANEALECFSKNKFDLVITDYRMPTMNGVELISELRGSRPEIPIILISGVADTLGLDSQTTGADVVIQKSNHEVANLERSVQRLLNRKAVKKPAQKHAAAGSRHVAV
jgi:CheY-like chemotaxis protein